MVLTGRTKHVNFGMRHGKIKMKLTRLLIADDHQLFLDGVVSLLKTEKSFEITVAHDGYEVLDKVKRQPFDVCLLDIGMPRLDGISTAKQLREVAPELKIIILSTYNDKAIVSEMMKVGVAGYLMKNCTKSELIEAVQCALAGEQYFSDDVKNTIVNQYSTYLANHKSEVLLTPRETEIIQLLAREYTNEKIAETLNISFRTVETHRKNMLQKTNSHNLAGLLKFAYDSGLIP